MTTKTKPNTGGPKEVPIPDLEIIASEFRINPIDILRNDEVGKLPVGFTIPDNYKGGNVGYEINEGLERGGEGYSYSAYDKTGQRYSVKFVTTGQPVKLGTEEEVRNYMTTVNTVLDRDIRVVTANEFYLCIVSPWEKGKNLEKYRREHAPTEKEVKQFLMAIIEEDLLRLHEAPGKGQLHKDITPQNTIMDGELGNHPRLIDFGFITEQDSKKTTRSYAGKQNYVLFPPTNTPIDDLHSLRRTALFYLTGKDPDIATGRYVAQLLKDQSEMIKDPILRKALDRMAGENLENHNATAREILEILKSEPTTDLATTESLEKKVESTVSTFERGVKAVAKGVRYCLGVTFLAPKKMAEAPIVIGFPGEPESAEKNVFGPLILSIVTNGVTYGLLPEQYRLWYLALTATTNVISGIYEIGRYYENKTIETEGKIAEEPNKDVGAGIVETQEIHKGDKLPIKGKKKKKTYKKNPDQPNYINLNDKNIAHGSKKETEFNEEFLRKRAREILAKEEHERRKEEARKKSELLEIIKRVQEGKISNGNKN